MTKKKFVKCATKGCRKKATQLACEASYFLAKGGCTELVYPKPAMYCEAHANLLVGVRGAMEYTVNCPNCNCLFGV